MAQLPYTKKSFIERVRRHLADGWPDEEFSISQNEILLYIDTETASSMIGSVYGAAKFDGVLATPEAYIIQAELSGLVQDTNGEWCADLPQTPISLPLGYSITDMYFVDPTYGVSQPVLPIKTQRSAYRDFMPKPTGCSYRVLGKQVRVKSKDGSPLSGITLYAEMVSTRTEDVNEPMNLPDDILSVIFDKVVARCTQRMGLPKDIVKDDISSGNKSS